MSFSAFDHQCMSLALRLARKGLASTDPNPRVGCVLTIGDRVIANGWHRRAGDAHAEIFALKQSGTAAEGCTAYVTLEPCSHQGKTASCASALIKAGVHRVVGATVDPNPLVNGKGFKMLQDAGIQVETGLMKKESDDLNRGFVKRNTLGRPWVRIKLALSLDGATGLANGESKWITSPASRDDVQNWRARSSAIMTGIETVLADDPSLNVRIHDHERQPARVIVDSNWRTPADARTLGLPGQVVIAGCVTRPVPKELSSSNAILLQLPEDKEGMVYLPDLMQKLAEMDINEVQVESGATLAGSLVTQGLVDELLVYQAPVILGAGAMAAFDTGVMKSMADRIELECIESVRTGPDLRSIFRIREQQA